MSSIIANGDEWERSGAESDDLYQDFCDINMLEGREYAYGINESGMDYRIQPYKLKFKDSNDIAYLYRDKMAYSKEIVAVCNSIQAYFKLKSLLRLFKFGAQSRVETNEAKRKITIELSDSIEIKSFIKFIRNNNYIQNACKVIVNKRADGHLNVKITFKEVPLPKYKKRLRDFNFKYDSNEMAWTKIGLSEIEYMKVSNYLRKQNLI